MLPENNLYFLRFLGGHKPGVILLLTTQKSVARPSSAQLGQPLEISRAFSERGVARKASLGAVAVVPWAIVGAGVGRSRPPLAALPLSSRLRSWGCSLRVAAVDIGLSCDST